MGNILSPPVHKPSADQSRAQVDALYAARNEAFQESKACYARGDHAGAKHYSNKGKDLDAKAKAMSQSLADQIYQQNNQHRRPDEIDLHGLSVQQATKKVENALVMAKQQGLESLTLIVGRGLHSGPSGPKLKPAIMSLIQQHNLRVTAGKPNEGCLFVEFVKPEERGWFSNFISGCVIC